MAIDLAAWSDDVGAERARRLFGDTFDAEPGGVWAAPGRVNLIGEHVDYNAGLCLPIALPHRTFAAVSPRQDGQVRLVSSLGPSDVWVGSLADIGPGRVRGLAAYAGGVAWAMRTVDLPVTGLDVAVSSCVPLGAGLSSSAALECAVAVALDDLLGLGLSADDAGRAQLAQVCVRAENEIAAAPTGGMDQAASLRTREGSAMLLDCRDGSVEHVPFDPAADDLALLVIDTRAEHALVDGQYGARRAACERAAAALGLATLREVDDLADALAQLPVESDRRRVRHVVTEIGRVSLVADLLRENKLRDVGELFFASHDSLRDDYEVSCAELDLTVEVARKGGALGARMTGGGFGGSAIALIRAGDAETIADQIEAGFADAGFSAPAFLLAEAGAPAGRVR